MKTHTLKGTIQYQDVSLGFWGIISHDGKEYLPINLPDRLKVEGKPVSIEFQEAKDSMNIFMWGTPIQIISIMNAV